jgi:hypothetical protein
MAGPFTLGYTSHTFSIVARCPRTRMFGTAIATSSIAVAARCSYAKAGIGAIATQASTDPRARAPFFGTSLEESPGSIWVRCQVTPGRSKACRRATESATEKNRPIERLGKGEKVR